MKFLQKKVIFLAVIALSFSNNSCSLLKNEPQILLPNVSLNKQQLAQVESRVKEISKKLNLSKKQKSKVKSAVKKYAVTILAIRKSSYSGTKKIQLAKKQVKNLENNLKNILKKDQFTNYIFFKRERHKDFYNKNK